MTEAFQARIKTAPAPKSTLVKKMSDITFVLLKNIVKKSDGIVIFPVAPDICLNVCAWRENKF